MSKCVAVPDEVYKVIKQLDLDLREFKFRKEKGENPELWPSPLVLQENGLLNRNRFDMHEMAILLRREGINANIKTYFSGKITCLELATNN
jgi:hypothetical protein